jgi:gamma-glutamyl:cysteine ligase YbdK (ATP-grasp superfamily)
MCNLLTPVVIALCGNSPIASGVNTDFCCAREGLMKQCQPEHHRHGIPATPFHSAEHFFKEFMSLPFLMRPGNTTQH